MARNRSRVVVAVEAAFLAVAVAFLVIHFAFPDLIEKVQAVVLPRESAPPAQAARPVKADNAAAVRLTAVMTVPARDMYAAFADQYRMRPDRRVRQAFETLARRWGQWRGEDAAGRFAAGAARADGGNVVIPLLRDEVAVCNVVLPVPATFAQMQASLNDWVAAMDDAGHRPRPVPDRAARTTRDFEEAIRLIDTVDPRYVVAGLTTLERTWREGARDARVLRAAARGYATLLLVLQPDEMGIADPFAAEALAFLALARRADPKLSLAREEALLAMAMGYRAHASGLLQRIPSRLRSPADKVLDAYMRQDLPSLKNRARMPGSGVLGAYLLARHYREIGLRGEAKAAARKLLEGWPSLYPSAVEVIQSGDIGDEKILTILYPHEITEQVRALVDPGALKSLPSWIDLVKKIVDGRVMPLPEFERLLDAWKPYGDDNAVRFIVDAERAKGVFRCLYADAVYFRFHLLFDTWTVRDEAGAYVESLAASDNTHPLVTFMRGKIAVDRGDRAVADRLFETVVSNAGAGGDLAYRAYVEVSDELTRIRLLPAVVGRMDGRPGHMLLAGWLFRNANNDDLSARYYAAGLASDPYAYWAYAGFAYVRGTDAPLRAALKTNPNSYILLKEAGEYLAAKNDAASKEAGERAYAAAQALAPSVGDLASERAKVLRDLGRRDEGIKVLNAWIERYGDDGLETVIINAQRARTYVKLGRPRDALRVLGDDARSMQANAVVAAAEIHEALGNPDRAWGFYLAAVERYPTVGWTRAEAAGFLWRHGAHDQAATLVAEGRRTRNPRGKWYRAEFLDVFREAPHDNIVRAVDALKACGATSDELLSLAWGLQYEAGRMEAAFAVASGLRDPRSEGLDVHLGVDAYGILRDWKGGKAAMDYLRARVPAGSKAVLMLALHRRGYYDAVLEQMGDPAALGPVWQENMWLQKLLAWLALERKPAGLAAEFDAHYGTPMSNKYHASGRYLLGMISRDDLLDQARLPKDRCEFAYYIGFSERMKGNYAEAAQWYHLCRETLLDKNGEFHFASDELLSWAFMGIDNRHRYLKDDVATMEKSWRRPVSGRSVM